MTEDGRPSLIERVRSGDWDAIEDLVSSTIAPTFDAALHLVGDPAQAVHETEEALLSLLLAIHRGELTSGDPLRFAAMSLSASARAARLSPFSSGLTAEDLIVIDRRPDEARRAEIGKLAAADRIAAILAFSLDLTPEDLAAPLGRSASEISSAIDAVLAALPHDDPAEAFRNILDARASQVRVPKDLDERVLDRFEESIG